MFLKGSNAGDVPALLLRLLTKLANGDVAILILRLLDKRISQCEVPLLLCLFRTPVKPFATTLFEPGTRWQAVRQHGLQKRTERWCGPDFVQVRGRVSALLEVLHIHLKSVSGVDNSVHKFTTGVARGMRDTLKHSSAAYQARVSTQENSFSRGAF